MSASCGVCLGSADAGDYHPACLKELFGTPHLPALDLDENRLLEVAMAMVGHTSISGVQKKISLTLDKATLRYTVERSQYILKPPATTFPQLPENEHASMRLADAFGINIPPCGLLRLRDSRVAYIVRRFDRLDDGKKLQMEDFCQLSELSPKDKYKGTAERCVKILRKYATEPLLDILVLFRVLVFSWWTGNGDMHLKNFSILRGTDGRYQLSPAYDLVATDIYPGMEQGMALTVDGRKTNLTRPDWLRFAKTCGLPEKVAAAVLDDVVKFTDSANRLISSSWLSEEYKEKSLKMLAQRSKSMI